MSERWLPISGFVGIYEVSDLGRVRSLDRIDIGGYRRKGQLLSIGWNGHHSQVQLYNGKRRPCLVHRLVLEAFVGLCPDGMEGCHDNGLSKDNRLENLRWDTKRNNEADKVEHGTLLRGEMAPWAKLNNGDIARMFDLRRAGLAQWKIAEWLGVSTMTVNRALNGKTWAHLGMSRVA